MRRQKQTGAYIVTGPQEAEKRAVNIGHGVSIALDPCRKRRTEEGCFTYYVRDILGTTTYATATKRDDGSIVVLPAVVA